MPVHLLSAQSGQGIDELIDLIAGHAAFLGREGRLESRRRTQTATWLRDAVREEFGRHGLALAGDRLQGMAVSPGRSPFCQLRALARDLRTERMPRPLVSQLGR